MSRAFRSTCFLFHHLHKPLIITIFLLAFLFHFHELSLAKNTDSVKLFLAAETSDPDQDNNQNSKKENQQNSNGDDNGPNADMWNYYDDDYFPPEFALLDTDTQGG